MNAIEMLKQDHKKVQELFRKFETAGEHAFQQKRQIAEKTFEELEQHTLLEEEFFYPAVRVVNHSGNDMVNEAVEEHDIVKNLIRELRAMAPDNDEYEAKFTVLTETVRHHVQEEESEMMPHAATRLGEAELKELGDQMAERKRALMEPSFVSGTIRQAKQLVTKAFDALTNGAMTTSGQKRRAAKKSKTKRPRRKRVPRTMAQAASRSAQGKKRTAARKVRRAVAKTKRVIKTAARTATPRAAARGANGRKKLARGVGR